MNNIITWCNANKEWCFSGIGVLVVGLILAMFTNVGKWVYGLFTRKQPTPIGPSPQASAPAKSLDDVKKSVQILFIDDDTKFKVVSILKQSGWQNTLIIKDVAALDDPTIARTDIFFVDINGVGLKLRFKDGGLGLALALKTKYPKKKVVIYSAETKGERFHEAWKKTDTHLPKNADPYEFQQIVEDFALGRGD